MLQLNELLHESQREPYCVIRGKDHEALPDRSQYAILEHYCDNPACRCKAVVAIVVRLNKRNKLVGKPVAVIDYDWSSRKTRSQPQLTKESQQTVLARDILDAYRQLIQAEWYRGRLKTDYDCVKKLTKQPVNERADKTPLLEELGRNDPCFCGSGLKHKKCCLKRARQ